MPDLFSAHGTDDQAEQICPVDGDVLFYPRSPWSERAQELFSLLEQQLAWQEGFVSLFGKTYKQPRLFAWYGDQDASYAYSGTRYEPRPWSPVLRQLRDELTRFCGGDFNSVLANLYRDGSDGMGLHSDDEPELGPEPLIASLSFGETRFFRLKHKYRAELAPIKIALEPGSLLLMRGSTQRYWKHEIPKTKRPCEARVNLTFRRVHPDLSPE
ncbi:MAG: alpha-ketoglutarate-dependent dioxygenase AlkB [Pseudomonadota bacterium]